MVKSNLFRAIWMLAFCKERVFFSSACVELVSDQKPPLKLLCGILHQCVSTVLSVELQQKLKPSYNNNGNKNIKPVPLADKQHWQLHE